MKSKVRIILIVIIILTISGSIIALTFRYYYVHNIEVKPEIIEKIGADFSKESLVYFSEVGIGRNCSLDDKLSKWTKSKVTIGVFGHPTEQDLETLYATVDTLNSILDHNELLISPDTSDVDITMRFLSMEALIDLYPESDAILATRGMFRPKKGFFYNMRSAEIIFNTGLIKRQARKHVILEELTQSLGIINDSDRYPHSIFYDSLSYDTVFASIDKDALRLLYNYDLPNGLTKAKFRTLLSLESEEFRDYCENLFSD